MIKGRYQATKEDILERHSEEELFRRYCPEFKKLNVPFKSEFREEQIPSCRISRLRVGIRYRDFGSTDPTMDIWAYLMKKFGEDFRTVVNRVAGDLGMVKPLVNPNTSKSVLKIVKDPYDDPAKKIDIKRRDWTIFDQKYWGQYEITIDLLEEYNICPISCFWINGVISYVHDLGYSYNYYHHRGTILRKIYQPNAIRKNKWRSNIDNTVVQGIDNIPKTADLLIISSSMKDIMVLRLIGFPAVAPNSEQAWIPEKVWEKFKQRYKRIVILFDSDEPGFLSACHFSLLYNVPYIVIPPYLFKPGFKDPSDLVSQVKNLSFVKDIINQQLDMLTEEAIIIEYKFIKNNRVHTRQAPVYAKDETSAIEQLTELLMKFGVEPFECKQVTLSNLNQEQK